MVSAPQGTHESRESFPRTWLLISGGALLLLAVGLIGLVIGAKVFGLIGYYSVPTGSMTPTIANHGHVLVEGVSYLLGNPRRGDIVVYKTDEVLPTQPSEKFLKRIVGLPGDVLELKDERLLINGKPPSEYLAALKPVDQLPYFSMAKYLGSDDSRFHVQPGEYFVLGDNPTNSLDSRFHGPVPRRAISGKVWLILP